MNLATTHTKHRILQTTLIVTACICALYGWWVPTTGLVVATLVLFRTYSVALVGLVLDTIYTPSLTTDLPTFPFTLLFVALATAIFYIQPHLRDPLA